MSIRKSAGFSLVEIMIVLFIIGLLFSLIGPRIAKVILSGNETATQATLNSIKTAIFEYQMDIGSYPKTLQHIIENVDNNSKWKGPYLEGQKEVPADKWGNSLLYNLPPKVFGKEYKYFEVLSYGPKGEAAEPTEYLKQGA